MVNIHAVVRFVRNQQLGLGRPIAMAIITRWFQSPDILVRKAEQPLFREIGITDLFKYSSIARSDVRGGPCPKWIPQGLAEFASRR